ncbi:MAG: motility protein A [Nitrospinota bacterium]
MDIATIIGILLGFGLILTSLVMGGGIGAFVDIPGMLIVFGGTIAATLMMYPLANVLNTVKVATKVFTLKLQHPQKLIKDIVALAEKARKENVLALEKVSVKNAFLKKGVRLLVDGKTPLIIDDLMSTELTSLKDRHRLGHDVFESMGEMAPAFGMIGTLIGLVQMLQALDDPASIGPAMAVALLTTFYGAVLANLVFIPISKKLELRSREESKLYELIIEGITSMGGMENPRSIQEKLSLLLAPQERKLK